MNSAAVVEKKRSQVLKEKIHQRGARFGSKKELTAIAVAAQDSVLIFFRK